MNKLITWIVSIVFCSTVVAQTNRIDTVRGDAPELAHFGEYTIGVRTTNMTIMDTVDVANTERGGDNVIYNRELPVEIWYPATLSSGQEPGGSYQVITRNPAITATLYGKAVRDAKPHASDGPYPLVIISHGHPGNRFLMSHSAESLASKGYVVASIDHTDSTYDSSQNFQSTLYHRPYDQRFVIETLASVTGADSFFSDMIDGENVGIIGYSMGGYGLLNNLGGGYNDDMVENFLAPPNGLLAAHTSGNVDYRNNLDSRIRAGVAVGPWGKNLNLWRDEDLEGVTVPTFYIAGSADTVSGYKNGTRAIYEAAINSDRYLLTFKNAGHNAGAPIPLPVEIRDSEDQTGASHYTDPVWDNTRMNNIMDHFVTAYFDYHLKGEESKLEYFDLVPDGADGNYSVSNGVENDNHTYWKGFGAGTAVGLMMEHLAPGE